MTEAQWLACFDPHLMRDFLRGKVSDRKLRLLTCDEVCRYYGPLLGNLPVSRAAINVAERFADGRCSVAELELARLQAAQAAALVHDETMREAAEEAALTTAADVRWILDGRSRSVGKPWSVQVKQLHEFFGNPIRRARLDPTWLAWNDGTIRKIAQAIYDERAFERMPILADALDDAGCDNADILNHCRQPRVHVRGCWVVDLLLGKE